MHEMVKSLKAVTDKLTQRKGRNSKDPEQEISGSENFGIRTFKTRKFRTRKFRTRRIQPKVITRINTKNPIY